MNLIQYLNDRETRAVGRVVGHDRVESVAGDDGVYGIANEAITRNVELSQVIEERLTGKTLDYLRLIEDCRLLPPIDHPDPAHLLVTGTGLTHLGSADARDEMHHKVVETTSEQMTDSMKMFRMGLAGGKPDDGSIGVQPEWFYKGDGTNVVAPGEPFSMPSFALDGGEEPEVAGIYLIDAAGDPWRAGFTLGNEFSDHVLEKENYLFLAHSKLRQCSVGPELLTGSLPLHVEGRVRVRRSGETVWEDTWLSGEDNMSHHVDGLEHHHFKYDLFRRPGDAHIHFFGTAVLSYTAGILCEPGDVFEIESDVFGKPLINPLRRGSDRGKVVVRQL